MSTFTLVDRALGSFTLRPLRLPGDVDLLHSWVTHPKAAFWMMQDATPEQVEAEYRRIAAHPHHDAFLGRWNGVPAFLAERYDPARVELAGLYDARDGDVGMHFLCAPATTPTHGFTLTVITTVMAWLFADPATRRVVVEPDIRNTAVHALNAAVGFEVAGPVTNTEQRAILSTCTLEQFMTLRGVPA